MSSSAWLITGAAMLISWTGRSVSIAPKSEYARQSWSGVSEQFWGRSEALTYSSLHCVLCFLSAPPLWLWLLLKMLKKKKKTQPPLLPLLKKRQNKTTCF